MAADGAATGSQAPCKISDRGLNIFAKCEISCRRFRAMVADLSGSAATRGLQAGILSSLDFVHNLPLQKLNDRLKLFPFVDPVPFDDRLTEIVSALAEWMQFVTAPDWIVQVVQAVDEVHKARVEAENRRSEGLAGAASPASRGAKVAAGGAGGKSGLSAIAPLHPEDAQNGIGLATEADALEKLSELGHFSYPMPLKMRDLQAMVRPFMEVNSTHHISGVDAIISELIRALLQLFHVVQAWGEALVAHMECWAEATSAEERVIAICMLCTVLDMDAFDALHRLQQVPMTTSLAMTRADLEAARRQMASIAQQRLLRGPPTLTLQQDGWVYPPRLDVDDTFDDIVARRKAGYVDLQPEGTRLEAFNWWRQQGFVDGAPTSILMNALLAHLVDAGLHPDPWVAEMLPKVGERLFGVQTTCNGFLNKFLPALGGYMSSSGQAVPVGYALPLLSNAALCAETILHFLRQWVDVTSVVPEVEPVEAPRSPKIHQRALPRDALDLPVVGHSTRDVQDLIEGVRHISEQVLKVPAEKSRYIIDSSMLHAWELEKELHRDIVELLLPHHRDLGPYHDIVVDGAARPVGDNGKNGAHSRLPPLVGEIDDFFGLRLVDWPADCVGTSKFVKYFKDGRLIARSQLKDLPQLPWCFGSDRRNTLIVDVPDLPGCTPISRFHCIFAKSQVQRNRVVVMSQGSSDAPMYIVCPKYQPLQLHNGDRLVCHAWTFEMQITPSGIQSSSLSILTEDGGIFKVPEDGCHIGAGTHSSKVPGEPDFPATKFSLKQRLDGIAPVHLAIHYRPAQDRWSVVDHSPDPTGTLVLLKTGMAFPLSVGLRVKLGPLVLEPVTALADKP